MLRTYRWIPALLAAVALLSVGNPGSLIAQPPAAKQAAARLQFRPDSLLVKPAAGAPAGALNALHSANGVAVSNTFPRFGNLQVLRLPANLSVERALAIYRQNPLVEYAEPDYIYSTTQVQSIPNDTSFSQLWGMHNTGQTGGTADADIDAPEAWSLRTDASSVIVGVIDTGIDYTHPDLAANVWVNPNEIPNNNIDDDGNGYVDDVYGINSITNTGNPMDDQATTYHGTHVSGTIGANGNNGLGVAGVAWNVKLMGLKFLDSTGSGSSSNAIKCIDYAIAKGAHVLSNSWGGGGYSQALYDAINRARTAGIIFVAAAGNSALDTDTNIFYPAGYRLSNVVAVASTDSRDARSSFSNYGYSTVHLGAPGSSIYSTQAGGTYQSLSGTSMATPHVSGALALIKAHFPAYTMAELINRLLTSTDPISSMNATTISGGRLNIYKALAGIERPIAQVTASPKGGEPGVTVTFTDGSFGNITSRTLDFGDGSSPVNFSGSATHTYPNLGTYTATLTVNGPSGTATRTQTIAVTRNYDVVADTYQWVDTTGMASVALTDDSASGAIALPFSFPFYGSNYSSLYIGSNGLITFGSNSGTASYSNDAIPSTAAPNAAIYAFWDDLDPGAVTTDFIRYGTTPDGNFVVSWEGVPAFNNPTLPLTFQVVLTPAGVVRIQYQEVQAANTAFGAGRSATVGVEHPAGLVARRYSLNGSPLLANNTAIRFTWPTGAAPAAPSNLTATGASGSQINLTWTDNASDETGVYVERATDGSTFTQIAQLAAGVTAYQNTGLSSGPTYSYRVRAFNGVGNSGYSNTAAASVLPTPVAPSNLAATALSGTQINLAWLDNATDETGYYVERAADGSAFTQIAQLGPGANAYQNTGLSAGINYSYRVRAFNNNGNSGYSNTAAASVLTAPTAPSNLTAAAVSGAQINLAWADNSNNETGFGVERSTDNVNFAPLVQLGAGVTAYQNSGLTANTTYYYRIYAINNIGNSANSNTASATPPQPPAAPASATATAASATQINISWTDSSNNETGFRVYRSTDGNNFAQIVQLGAGVTAYQNTGLTADTTYYYRVVAYNLGGESTPAAAQARTTSSAPAAPSGLTATALNTSSIRLNWTDNSNNETEFVIERLSGKVYSAVGSVGAGFTTWTDTGLKLGSKYTYRVKARSLVGDSAYSNTANATTLRR